MPGLLGSLTAAAGTLDAIQQALNVVQNNVSNASTAGYAAQRSILSPVLFDPEGGPSGGVQFSGAQSLRNENSEAYLYQQSSSLGSSQAISTALTSLDSSLSISTSSGIPAALTAFSSAFSALSQDPNNASDREQVLTTAQNVALTFQGVANAVSGASHNADSQINSTINQINSLAGQISQLNAQQSSNATKDPNVDASLHADLDTLSSLLNITSSFSSNGTVTVLIDGQSPLISDSTAFPLATSLADSGPNSNYPDGVPSRTVLDSSGNDITGKISGGQLGGLLQVRNTVLAGIQGDTNQPGSLNVLAKGVADQVNSVLTSGETSSGPPAVPGVPLFQYAPSTAPGIAQSLTVTTITPGQIATIDPGPPASNNGIATRLGNFANSTNPADKINGLSATEFYAQIATDFGNQLSAANTTQTQQTQAVAQAQNLISQSSGVSLNQEAVYLIQFQNAYQATSKVVNVLDQLTQTTIGLISQG